MSPASFSCLRCCETVDWASGSSSTMSPTMQPSCRTSKRRMETRTGCAIAFASRASCALASPSSAGTGAIGSAGGQHALVWDFSTQPPPCSERSSSIYDKTDRTVKVFPAPKSTERSIGTATRRRSATGACPHRRGARSAYGAHAPTARTTKPQTFRLGALSVWRRQQDSNL